MNRIKVLSVVYMLFASFLVYLISVICLDRLTISGALGFEGLSSSFTLLRTFSLVQTSVILFCPIMIVLFIYYFVKMKYEPKEKDNPSLLEKEKEKSKKIKYLLLKISFGFAATSFIAFKSFTANISNGMKSLDVFSSSLLSYMSKLELLMEKYEYIFQIHCYAMIVTIYLLIFALSFFVRETLYQKKLDNLSKDLKRVTEVDVA